MAKPSRSPATASPTKVPRAATGGSPPARRRRSDGEESHREILRAAANLASVLGLEGLSISSLAEHVGLSKSGLFAHFRSKEDLQAETIEFAGEIFREDVVAPALEEPEGTARIRALVRRFLDHVRRRTFPGGCFFAAVSAEFDGRPGKLRDRIAEFYRAWFDLFVENVDAAKAKGEVDRSVDAAQVAFEVIAMVVGAHGSFVLHGDAAVLDRASRGMETILAVHAGKRARTRR